MVRLTPGKDNKRFQRIPAGAACSTRKAAAVEERLLLGRGGAAEHGVAVREAAEAADDVGVQLGPFEGVGVAARAVERDAALLVGERLGMLERQVEEAALRHRDLPVEAASDRARGDLARKRIGREGALALVIVLDQFPRNMFRGGARCYAADALARAAARRAIALFEAHDAATGDMDGLKWAVIHRDIIRRFGRFPHRNAMLGRANTPQEQAFLDAGGFAG